ncbi:MAG: NAD-dependent epimerase/dehydratase family protein, partial [Chlamydiae bacterium]|nr:NAD-dependent epimerase/dehydratase family protein [Chlamydiota bacterium]
MKVLITGGAGFLGSHLAELHLRLGDEVCVIDSLVSGKQENIASFLSYKSFRFIQEDVTKCLELDNLVAEADRIYHMAAIVGVKLVLAHPIEVLSQNIHSCEKVLQAMAKMQSSARLLIASSSCVYNDNPVGSLQQEEALLTLSWKQPLQQPYTVSKIVNELMGLSYNQLHCVIVRPFNVVGPCQTGRYGMVVPTFIRQAL